MHNSGQSLGSLVFIMLGKNISNIQIRLVKMASIRGAMRKVSYLLEETLSFSL